MKREGYKRNDSYLPISGTSLTFESVSFTVVGVKVYTY